jgi:hypothetical protein
MIFVLDCLIINSLAYFDPLRCFPLTFVGYENSDSFKFREFF